MNSPGDLSSNTLLPCPFCGGKAGIHRSHDADGMLWVGVRCQGCGAASTQDWCSPGNDCPIFYEGIRNSWNRRPAHEPPAVDVAPIAKLTVRDGLVQRAGLYAPGLPDGDHDVFPVPLSPKGELRPHVLAEPPTDALTLEQLTAAIAYMGCDTDREYTPEAFARDLFAAARQSSTKSAVCEHDLQKPSHTVWVSDSGKVARCSACGQQWSPVETSASKVIEEKCDWCAGVGSVGTPWCSFCGGKGVRRRDSRAYP